MIKLPVELRKVAFHQSLHLLVQQNFGAEQQRGLWLLDGELKDFFSFAKVEQDVHPKLFIGRIMIYPAEIVVACNRFPPKRKMKQSPSLGK